MNTKNLLIASLAGGAVSIVLANTPGLSFVNCLLCAGFWGAAILAVWLYKRLTGTVTLQQAVIVGVLTGVWAGIVGFALSFVNLAGFQALMESYSRFLPAGTNIDMGSFTSGPMNIVFTLIGVLVDVILGAVGGLIGGAIFRSKS